MSRILLTLLVTFFLGEAAFAAARVVYIGDSHSAGCFGEELDVALRPGVRSAATCGSSAANWLQPGGNSTTCDYRACDGVGKCEKSRRGGKSPSFAEILAAEKIESTSSFAVIALGSNMLKANRLQVRKDVTALIAQAKAARRKCIWIGPPQAADFFIERKQYEHFVLELAKLTRAEGCIFIDSNDKTSRATLTDPIGLHYGCKEAKQWARKVAEEIAPILNPRKPVSFPPDSAGAVKAD